MTNGEVLPDAATSFTDWLTSLKVLLLSLVMAVPAGAAWWLLAPLPRLRVGAQGVLFVGGQTETGIAADAWFAVSALVAGAVCAAVAFRITGRSTVQVLIALTLGGVVAALAAWWIGMILGPAPVDVRAETLSVGDEFHGPLELSARGVLLAWPMAAVITYFSLVAGLEPVSHAVRGRRRRQRGRGRGVSSETPRS
jgi:hypothetical protein